LALAAAYSTTTPDAKYLSYKRWGRHQIRQGGRPAPYAFLEVQMSQEKNNGAQAGLLVVFGMEDLKPRAAFFKEAQADLVNRAAAAMNLRTFKATTEEQLAIAQKLPAGRLYANGKGFVPFVRRELYRKVIGAAGLSEPALDRQDPASGRTDPDAQTAVPALDPPTNWEAIGAGHVVLANADDGWAEAVVLARKGEVLTLCWRDYPQYKPFQCHASMVALFSPTMT
jgi:hypothetical protein